jgi:putative SOS response-associated peptidase YedK
LHWGLIPSWSKDRKISSRLINARAETLTEKPSFRNAYQHRRGLIPAFLSGRPLKPGNNPTIFINRSLPCSLLLGYGSIGNTNRKPFIPAPSLPPIYDRMPVIITPDFYNHWLDKEMAVEMAEFLAADAYSNMQLTPISTRVNNPLHNDEQCLADITQSMGLRGYR